MCDVPDIMVYSTVQSVHSIHRQVLVSTCASWLMKKLMQLIIEWVATALIVPSNWPTNPNGREKMVMTRFFRPASYCITLLCLCTHFALTMADRSLFNINMFTACPNHMSPIRNSEAFRVTLPWRRILDGVLHSWAATERLYFRQCHPGLRASALEKPL